MPSIQELIQKNLRERQPAAPTGNAQAQIQATLAAGTGKGVSGGGPKASAVGQQAAQSQVAGQQSALADQATLQAEQLRQQGAAQTQQQELAAEQLASTQRTVEGQLNTQAALGAGGRAGAADQFGLQLGAQERLKTEAVANAFSQQLQELASQRKTTVADMFGEFGRGNQDLAARKDAAKLEQLAFRMALADNTYMRDLQQIGQLRRLDNDLSWQKESQRLTLGNEMSLLLDGFGWQTAFNADERAWGLEMEKMGNSQALDIAKSAAKDANTQQQVSGVTTAAGAVASGYDWKSGNSETATPRTETTNTGGGTYRTNQ